MLPGVDVASWQGPPGDWKTDAGDIGWAAVKLTELYPDGSRYTDPDAAADIEWLRASGKGIVHYLFAHPAAPVEDTVRFFVSVLDQVRLADGDGIAVDLEVTDGRNPAQVSVWARQLLRKLEAALHRKPVLYTYISFAGDGNCSGLAPWPLWISDPSSPPGEPRVPAPWTTWAIHQSYIPPGTAAGIDRDVARWPSLDGMRAALGKTAPPHVTRTRTEEETMPQLLTRGAGAVTPVAFPDGAASIRVFPAGNAQLHYQFEGMTMESLILAVATGARTIPVPAGKHGIRFVRVDDGADDISYAISLATGQ